ncbi:asparagine synthase-related protein [Actinomadura sp. WMMB 499]|uniref:asparagine synthase-related protein n=1 Tax=Actinomadura sp. WMMB 499 TaxID=1219491 RepID=UPI00159E9F1C|nr:asparagine synthase-related protein [Actinomadura sp. WMMB 499]
MDSASAAAAEAIPVPADRLVPSRWASDDGAIVLLSWTNEPEHRLVPRPLIAADERVLGYTGYLAEPDIGEKELLETADPAAAVESMGGVFAVFRAHRDGFDAATSIARVCPVYFAESEEFCFIGSRALLVHLTERAARTGLTKPPVAHEIMALQPMVRHGFFTNDDTPFAGVRALPADAVLTAAPGRGATVRERAVPDAEPMPADARERRRRVQRLAEALVDAAAPLAAHGEPVELALSGGRDSRIMAAVLRAAEVPMIATTHGFADDPDVVLARRIAGLLGLEHRVSLTATTARDDAPDAVTVGHPLLRAHDIVRRCEGMTSAYERVGGWAPYRTVPKTSGSGGETLRGGHLYDQKDLTPAGIRKRVRTIFKSAEGFCTPEANAAADEQLARWAARTAEDGPRVLDLLYLFYRSGRWIVGSHTATTMNTPSYHPFFDNRAVREALALPPEWRASEEVVYLLIESLAPKLASVPPEGKRWRFEADGPRRLREWPAWRRRAAVLPKGRTSGFNWRRTFDEPFLALLRDQVLDGPSELWEIVNRRKFEEHFATVPTGWTNQLWHIYTLSVLLSGMWREPRPDLPDVRIPIPR